MFLDGEDVSEAIRMPEISICASDVSSLPAVRSFLLEMQRKLAREHNVVMDGRDIGTVVLLTLTSRYSSPPALSSAQSAACSSLRPRAWTQALTRF